MDIITKIQDWYGGNCNGEWEHQKGIRIFTIDNPGWGVEINLTGTGLESKKFNEIQYNYKNDRDWYRCWIENKIWNGVGGAKNLEVILRTFLEWADEKKDM